MDSNSPAAFQLAYTVVCTISACIIVSGLVMLLPFNRVMASSMEAGQYESV